MFKSSQEIPFARLLAESIAPRDLSRSQAEGVHSHLTIHGNRKISNNNVFGTGGDFVDFVERLRSVLYCSVV